MKLESRDLSHLMTSFLILLLLALSGALLLKVSLDALDAARLRHRQAERQATVAITRLARTRVDRIKRELAAYRELAHRGVLGPEQRLDWLDEIREISRRLNLDDLKFELSPQRLLSGGTTNGYRFMASNMTLQMRLPHEAKLLDFLAELRTSAHADVRINRCRVERLPPAAHRRKARLSAECSIDWITVREKK